MADIISESSRPATLPAVLGSRRLLLRPLRASDAGPLSLYAGDLRVAQMTTSIPHPYPPGSAEAFIERQARPGATEQVWVIDGQPMGAGELIGTIGFKIARREIGYWVGPPFWNTGLASEALAVLLPVFAEAGLPDVQATVFADNPASAHVLQKHGFVETGPVELFSVARDAMVSARHFLLDTAGLAAAGE